MAKVIESASQAIGTKGIVETTTPQTTADTEAAPLAWLTMETLLYLLIAGVAVGLRLWRLDGYPLTDTEAVHSLVALRLFDETAFEADYYSPLLVSLNALFFLLFGASDVSARLATVLLGSLLVIAPVTLRRQLGAPVCLIASALLAISPSTLYLSRTVNSDLAVALGALLMVAGFFNWITDGRQRWLLLLAGGLAVMLAAGPMAYSMLIVFGLIILIKLSDFRSLWLRGLYLTAKNDEGMINPIEEALEQQQDGANKYHIRNPAAEAKTPDETEATEVDKPTVQDSDTPSPQQVRTRESEEGLPTTHLKNVAIFFGLLLALLSTAGLFNLSGFSMVAASLNEWLNNFMPGADASGFNAVFLLTIYEPLLVIAGLAGLALIVMRGHFIGTVLIGWFVGTLLLNIAMIGRPDSSLILVLVPLAFLAAFGLAELGRGVLERGTWGNEGILLGTGLTIAAFGYIGLTRWLVSSCAADDLVCRYAWLQSVAGLLLFIVIAIFFGLMNNDLNAALRGAALVGVALGLLSAISIGWRLNYGPLMHLAYQPLSGVPASTGLVALTDTLAEQSAARVGDETLLDVTISGVESQALLWRLRDYDKLNTDGLIAIAPTSAIITPEIEELGLGEGYIGQDFALDALWSPVGMPLKDVLNWLIYREAETMPEGNKAVLWLTVDDNDE